MRLLDLFCGGGGSAMGFHRAGFDEITGVDIEPQPRYPFQFIQADVFEYLAQIIETGEIYAFDLINASPVCKGNTTLRFIHKRKYPDQITPLRKILRRTGKPYVIENVKGARLENPLMLCGTMFGLRVQRHRLFEIWPDTIWFPPAPCCHNGKASAAGRGGKVGYLPGTLENFEFITVIGNDYIADDGRRAMGIDWMTKKELSQAIPPAYTEWIGRQLLGMIGNGHDR